MNGFDRYPEVDLLTAVVGQFAGEKLCRVPGGWRGLSVSELDGLGLSPGEQRSVLALQELTERGYPELERGELASADDVIRIYSASLASLQHEVLLAIAVDGQHRFLEEIEIARGGRHGAAVVPADVFRPLIRAGANSAVLVHNHPSGDPQPSPEDVALTSAVSLVGDLVGIPLLDHVIIGAHGGGAVSLWQLGVIPHPKEKNDERDCT